MDYEIPEWLKIKGEIQYKILVFLHYVPIRIDIFFEQVTFLFFICLLIKPITS